eukprot:353993-Chlamydomonas_euryale.AAC.2
MPVNTMWRTLWPMDSGAVSVPPPLQPASRLQPCSAKHPRAADCASTSTYAPATAAAVATMRRSATLSARSVSFPPCNAVGSRRRVAAASASLKLPVSVLTDSYKSTHFMQYPAADEMVAVSFERVPFGQTHGRAARAATRARARCARNAPDDTR